MRTEGRNYGLMVLIAVQSVCAVFFLGDVVHDGLGATGSVFTDLHLIVEAVACIALILGIVVETQYLLDLSRRNREFRRGIQVASGELYNVIEEYFRTWKLTKAECDVALFAIKGMSNNEIAELRGSSEGTVKAQLNAVYRKAEVAGRGQLVSLLIDELLAEPMVQDGAAAG